MKNFLTPAEIAEATTEAGEKKAELRLLPMFLLAVLAGAFIGLGGLGSTMITQGMAGVSPGLAKFLGAAVFPVGLMLVVVAGAELFTGNNLMSMALMERKIGWRKLLRNWGVVWLGNLVGALILVGLIYLSGALSGWGEIRAVAIATDKANLGFWELISRGVLCNMLVVLAVWMATGARDVASKLWAVWFPIMLFVLCGFEHSVANMYFLPMGLALGADISGWQLLMNLGVVTLGNLIGGAMIIPAIYYIAYRKK